MNTVITGASSGIGEALAIEAASRGDNLFICGRNAQRLADVAEICRKKGAHVKAEIIDVSDSEAVTNWLEKCEKIYPIERVFANAGVSTGEETEENVRRTFSTNVSGVVNTVLPAIEIFRHGGKRKKKQIVITSSIAAYGPLKACPSYSASKACVKTWSIALRGMLRPEGIDVNVICPGFIRSRITDKNTCPMPFFMEADKAAKIILKRADKNKGIIAFPWPMRFGTWFLSTLPLCINEFINRLLPKKVI